MRILKVLGLLLEYPDEVLWENRDEALALVSADIPSLTPFVGELLAAPLLDRQADWCEVFERGRATSLLLFEHVHAESRDRGQAMVDLMNQYQQAGLLIDCRELPDYLPLYLEYLSILPLADAREGLQNIAPILALIGPLPVGHPSAGEKLRGGVVPIHARAHPEFPCAYASTRPQLRPRASWWPADAALPR